MLAGDIHVGVDSLIVDAQTGLTIRHITTSPFTNSPGKFHNALQGRLSDRYSYTHTPLGPVRNYATLDLAIRADGAVQADVELVEVPLPGAVKDHKPSENHAEADVHAHAGPKHRASL